MRQSDYEHLVHQLCEHLGLSESEVQANGLLRVGGREVHLHYDEAVEPGVIQFRLDLGPVGPDQQAWTWRRLLVSNFEWGANGILGWSLTPSEDHVVLTAQQPIAARNTSSDMVRWLRNFVSCAEQYWTALPSQRPIADIRALAPLQGVEMPDTQGASWEQLITAFCGHAGLDKNPFLFADGDTLTIDGVDLLMRHDRAAPGRFELCIDLGSDHDIATETLWRGLLWNNFVMGLCGRVLFGLHPQNDGVVLTFQHDLPVHATGEEFAALLRVTVAHARRFWADSRLATMQARELVQRSTVSALKRNRLTQ
jgi:hypothetical protein